MNISAQSYHQPANIETSINTTMAVADEEKEGVQGGHEQLGTINVDPTGKNGAKVSMLEEEENYTGKTTIIETSINTIMAVADEEKEGVEGGHEQLGTITVDPTGKNGARVSMLEEEENYTETLQEELNEIVAAFYECVSEEDIQAYQRYVEDIQGQRIAEQALIEPDMAPSFDLEDQDDDPVSLHELLTKGPVVLTFYRGKWCPHSNATLMRYQKELLPALEQYNATLVAISPMLKDGTAFLATKRDLQFSVCSDFDNTIAKAFRITFEVQPQTGPFMAKWGDHLTEYNSVDSWDIPLPATYVIAPNGRIAWSFLDNDPGIRAEPEDIVQQVARVSNAKDKQPQKSPKPRRNIFRSASGHSLQSLSPKFWKNTRTPKILTAEDAYNWAGLDGDGDDSSISGSSRHSTRSEGGRRHKKKNPKRRRARSQAATEFLAKYCSIRMNEAGATDDSQPCT